MNPPQRTIPDRARSLLLVALVAAAASACESGGGGGGCEVDEECPIGLVCDRASHTCVSRSAGDTAGASADAPAGLGDAGGTPDDAGGTADDAGGTADDAGPGAECGAERCIEVFFAAQLAPGLTRNCGLTSPGRWLDEGALEDPARRVYITGGVHADTPLCDADRETACLPEGVRQSVNLALGADVNGWKPNSVPLYDDGRNGDAVAGDGVYTRSFLLPYWPPEEGPDGAGMRLSYKYTFGTEGALWTGTEEWPGNARLLELVDLSGDGVVIRYDLFGDETTNKDRQNLLTPANGGCGLVVFAAQQAANPDYVECVMDSRENRVDTDGDCVLDAWASLTPAGGPLCEGIGRRLGPADWDATGDDDCDPTLFWDPDCQGLPDDEFTFDCSKTQCEYTDGICEAMQPCGAVSCLVEVDIGIPVARPCPNDPDCFGTRDEPALACEADGHCDTWCPALDGQSIDTDCGAGQGAEYCPGGEHADQCL